MESITKLCLKAMTRISQIQSKLLNTICQKQKKLKSGSVVGGNTTEDGTCITRAATRQPLQLPKARKTPGHHPARQRYGTWPSRAAQKIMQIDSFIVIV
jgi:hypothetical protein